MFVPPYLTWRKTALNRDFPHGIKDRVDFKSDGLLKHSEPTSTRRPLTQQDHSGPPDMTPLSLHSSEMPHEVKTISSYNYRRRHYMKKNNQEGKWKKLKLQRGHIAEIAELKLKKNSSSFLQFLHWLFCQWGQVRWLKSDEFELGPFL